MHSVQEFGMWVKVKGFYNEKGLHPYHWDPRFLETPTQSFFIKLLGRSLWESPNGTTHEPVSLRGRYGPCRHMTLIWASDYVVRLLNPLQIIGFLVLAKILE